jgi:hypothetical protein
MGSYTMPPSSSKSDIDLADRLRAALTPCDVGSGCLIGVGWQIIEPDPANPATLGWHRTYRGGALPMQVVIAKRAL